MALAVTAACAIASGATLHLLARSYLQRRFDAAMAEKLSAIARALEYEDGRVDLEFENVDMSEFAAPGAGGYLQIARGDRALYRSPSLAGRDLRRDGRIALDGPVRWMHQRVRARGDRGPALDLFIARDAGQIGATLRALTLGMLAVGAGTLLLLAAALRWAVTSGLRPVGAFSAAIGGIDVDGLDRPVHEADLPNELQPIARQFNAMLARLASAFARERRFAADVAHELRTPLAALRAEIDVTRARPRTGEAYAASLDRLSDVTAQMQAMVESLLQLAAIEAGRQPAATRRLAVDEQLDRAWAAAVTGRPDPLPFDVRRTLDPAAAVTCDPSLLSTVLQNVLHNAASYVDDGGTVTLTSRAEGDRVHVRVANTGSAVAAADVPRVFERLWRGDPSRTQSGMHFGLGLALARRAAEAMGGTIRAESEAGGVFAIDLDLPAADAQLMPR